MHGSAIVATRDAGGGVAVVGPMGMSMIICAELAFVCTEMTLRIFDRWTPKEEARLGAAFKDWERRSGA